MPWFTAPPTAMQGKLNSWETHLLKHILSIQPVLFTHLGTDLCYLMLIHKSGLISSRQVLRKPDLYTQNHPLQLRMMLEENVLDKYLLVFRHFHWPAPRVLTKYISFSHSCVYALHSLTKGKPFLPLPLAFLLSPQDQLCIPPSLPLQKLPTWVLLSAVSFLPTTFKLQHRLWYFLIVVFRHQSNKLGKSSGSDSAI